MRTAASTPRSAAEHREKMVHIGAQVIGGPVRRRFGHEAGELARGLRRLRNAGDFARPGLEAPVADGGRGAVEMLAFK